MSWLSLWAPKASHTASEYEDAFWPERRSLSWALRPERPFRCAVADGASASSYSGLWAKLLARAYGRARLLSSGGSWRLERQWRRIALKQAQSWYAEEAVRRGAFATLLGLAIAYENTWQATACGDSCLVQIRDERLCRAFPLQSAEAFSNTPALVPTSPTQKDWFEAAAGKWVAGDVFFLMTDALAQWFFTEVETQAHPWAVLWGLQRQDDFRYWLEGLRTEGMIRNDDVTLLQVKLHE